MSHVHFLLPNGADLREKGHLGSEHSYLFEVQAEVFDQHYFLNYLLKFPIFAYFQSKNLKQMSRYSLED